jgi:hypothetical protein
MLSRISRKTIRFFLDNASPMEVLKEDKYTELLIFSSLWWRISLAEFNALLTRSWACPTVHLLIKKIPTREEIRLVRKMTATNLLINWDFNVVFIETMPRVFPGNSGEERSVIPTMQNEG